MFYGKLMFWGFSQDICFGQERYIMRLFYSLITERAMLSSDSVIKPVTQNNSLGLVIGSNAGSLDTDQIFSYITLTSALPSTKQITWTDSSYSQWISQVCLQENHILEWHINVKPIEQCGSCITDINGAMKTPVWNYFTFDSEWSFPKVIGRGVYSVIAENMDTRYCMISNHSNSSSDHLTSVCLGFFIHKIGMIK